MAAIRGSRGPDCLIRRSPLSGSDTNRPLRLREDLSMLPRDYARLLPPGEVQALDFGAVPPVGRWVDYEQHPAYREFARSPSAGDRAAALGVFAKQALIIAGKRLIRYEMIPVSLRRPTGFRSALRFMAAAMRNMLVRSKRACLRSDLARSLQDHGCVVSVIPQAEFARLRELAEPAFLALEERRRKTEGNDRAFEESRACYDKASVASLFNEIEQQLRTAGVIDAASDYLGRRATLVDINPQINDRTDSFWRRIFPDLSLDRLPGAAYFHRDASGGDLKAIIYMEPVDASNGPFIYCVGSNRLRPPRIPDLICEINDSNGLSSTAPNLRRKFASLPRSLRIKGAFGNDVVEGSPIESHLLNSAWSITGPAGAVVLFDTKGIHRGGMVEQGERRVITCVIG